MQVIIQDTPSRACIHVARMIAAVIRSKPTAVLGLATGTTPIPVYQELVRMHREEGLDFSRVTTFNLDEYVGLSPKHQQSYHFYMQHQLFNHINIPPGNTFIPDGLAADIPAWCAEYEKNIREAGGIDIQLLGIGHDGHIGFNEPTSSLGSRTRIKTLTRQTVQDNARFFNNQADVPRHVITMGVGTIMESRQCVMLAYGSRKANAIASMVEGPVTAMCPATALQWHPRVDVVIDRAASEKLANADYYQWVYEGKPDWQRTP
jgi:glucosamine-6-phosphate deaminase